MLTLWNINDDDDNVVVVVIPREPASLNCHVADATRSCSPVGSSVVLRTWACLSLPLVAAGRRSGRGCRCRPCWAFAAICLVPVCWALAVGCRSLSSLRAVIESLGHLGGHGCLWWCEPRDMACRRHGRRTLCC